MSRDRIEAQAILTREQIAACLSHLRLESFDINADSPDHQDVGIAIVGHSKVVDAILALIPAAGMTPRELRAKIAEAIQLSDDQRVPEGYSNGFDDYEWISDWSLWIADRVLAVLPKDHLPAERGEPC